MSTKTPQKDLQIIKSIIDELQDDPTVKDIFKKYKIDIEEIHLLPIAFSDMDVSARTDHSIIYLNNSLKEDDSFPDNVKHYLVHELTHVAQQSTGTKPTKGSTDDTYLDNKDEQEGFQNQTEFISREHGEEVAEEYVEQVLDHHEVTDNMEREERRDELLSIASSTKIQKAVEYMRNTGEQLSIVDSARGILNADYAEWGEKQRKNTVPSGLNRVDIDTRPAGKLNAFFKNYDYAGEDKPDQNKPSLGMYARMNEHKSTEEYIKKDRKARRHFFEEQSRLGDVKKIIT